MVKFINAITGGDMWVADDHVEEYKAAGHKPAAINSATEEKPAEKPKTAAKKTTTKRGK